jgi:hypothetical protein
MCLNSLAGEANLNIKRAMQEMILLMILAIIPNVVIATPIPSAPDYSQIHTGNPYVSVSC